MCPANPRVLVALGWYDHRLHRGIERYAQSHGWHLQDGFVRERAVPWGWEGDGILAWLGANDDLAEFVLSARKPTVDFSFRRPQLKFTRVLEDTICQARLITDHFLSLGFRRFIFYSDTENWIYNERGNEFLESLRVTGRDAYWLKWHNSRNYCIDASAWKKKRKWLAGELKRVPKPVGIFAATDELALEVVETCGEVGVAVPDEVAVIGAGNSLLAVDALRIPISSVDTNLEALGYRGAALLDGLMRSKAPPKNPVRVPPAGLIVRKSTDFVAVGHAGLAKSLRYLQEHRNEPVGVNDLVKVSGMSRRGLHRMFMAHVGRPPGQEIQRIRLERAKKLLVESPKKLEVIAEESGFQSANSFWVAFKQATGVSPGEYRKMLFR